jgi:hypothetical protein
MELLRLRRNGGSHCGSLVILVTLELHYIEYTLKKKHIQLAGLIVDGKKQWTLDKYCVIVWRGFNYFMISFKSNNLLPSLFVTVTNGEEKQNV